MKIEHIISELGPARKTKARATAPGTLPPQPGSTPPAKTLSTTPGAIRKRTARAAAKVQPEVQPTTTQASTDRRSEPGIGSKMATGVGKFIQGTGNLASQVAGAVTQPIGAAVGGLKKGFRTANRGEVFRAPAYQQRDPGALSDPQAPESQVGANDLADLKAMIQRIDQRLTNAGIKETKKR